jgi:hypothetical protein
MTCHASKLVFVCPLCHRTSVVGPDLLGEEWDCSECGRPVVVTIPGRNAARLEMAAAAPPSSATDDRDVEPIPPVPFNTRLARFLHCSAETLGSPSARPISRMNFWSAGPFGPRCDPKPSWWIRLVLRRIHRLVRGSPAPR